MSQIGCCRRMRRHAAVCAPGKVFGTRGAVRDRLFTVTGLCESEPSL